MNNITQITVNGITHDVEDTKARKNINDAANAVKVTASDIDIIKVNDVSPLEHTVKTRVFGTNLFDISQLSVTTNTDEKLRGHISSVSPTSITITTTANHTANGYTISGKTLGELCPALKVGDSFVMSAVTDGFSKFVYLSTPYVGSIQFGTSYIVTEKMLQSSVVFYGYNASNGDKTTGDCEISNIQVELGETATDYEPYIDPSTVTVMRCGRNLLNPSGTKSQNGVSLTLDDTGMYTISGTTTASINMNVGNAFIKAGYKYKPTIFNYSGEIYPSFWNFTTQANMSKDSYGYLSSDVDTEISCFIYASAAGSTYNAKFSVMLELVDGNEGSEYELYDGWEGSPESDGDLEIPSISPCMTIFADASGANVYCEYNQETKTTICNFIKSLTPSLLNYNFIEQEVDSGNTIVVDIIPNTMVSVTLTEGVVDDITTGAIGMHLMRFQNNLLTPILPRGGECVLVIDTQNTELTWSLSSVNPGSYFWLNGQALELKPGHIYMVSITRVSNTGYLLVGGEFA